MPIRTVLLLLLALTGGASAAEAVDADVVVRGALICDGTGKAPYAGDIAIKGERIVAVGEVAVEGSPRVIDGAGLIVTPGFISHRELEWEHPGAVTSTNALPRSHG